MLKKTPPSTADSSPTDTSPPSGAHPNDHQALIKSLEDNWKRALADYQNLVRRVESDKLQYAKFANANLIARLLPPLDIIELAATHTQDLGVQMAAKQFHTALSEEGLQVIEPALDSVFDHLQHECSETVAISTGKSENTIAELVLKGYKIGDYVLRPARVKVYKQLST